MSSPINIPTWVECSLEIINKYIQQANLDNKILPKRISVQAYSAAVFFSFEQRKAEPFVRHNCFVAIPPVFVAAADMLARPHPHAPALFSPSLLVPPLAAAAHWR